jgi:chromosome segregation ATPase
VDEKHASLKDQLAAVTPLLEDLRAKKEERIKQISSVQSQIEKIKAQISDQSYENNDSSPINDNHDLSNRRLSDLRMQLHNLQKEKVKMIMTEICCSLNFLWSSHQMDISRIIKNGQFCFTFFFDMLYI